MDIDLDIDLDIDFHIDFEFDFAYEKYSFFGLIFALNFCLENTCSQIDRENDRIIYFLLISNQNRFQNQKID